ncbi:hypothetical protein QH494_18925 [Sphingomonas sp. AR_OL41]|uniref:hypothetical protein n=1 Tax=Sphingomonas sp. AR_OL41 TaxID=3042729 RepID=UPI002480C848|nr:hypothetical protein [Sphingomonas sp. AR_OL41]MDH7974266.1 hypothetical protein [Sphingomonas sp. AR_OL41]
MNAESSGIDPYDAVLADLRAKREQIDQAISVIENLRSGVRAAHPFARVASESHANDQGIIETAGMFLGMSIVDASKKLLALRKKTLGNVEIARELQAGGLAFSGSDPVNVVGSVLTRRFNNVGDVVKIGRGIWGLKEWYPGRTFKPSGKGSGGSASKESTDEGQHLLIEDVAGVTVSPPTSPPIPVA